MHKRKRDGNASFSRFYMESKVAKNTYNCRALSVSLLDNSAPIKQLLQQQLWVAMGLSSISLAATNSPNSTMLTPEMIPLHHLSDETCVLYRSAIALKLAPIWQQSAFDIANQLTASFPTLSQDTAGGTRLDFSVEVVLPGWINFRLSDRGLAAWLQQMIQLPPQVHQRQLDASIKYAHQGSPEYQQNPPSTEASTRERNQESPLSTQHSENLFCVQYIHARCCSLLCLAHCQDLIKLRDLDFKTVSWRFVEPNPIPWLNDDQGADTGQVLLRLMHPAERRLITQLLELQDELGDSSQIYWVKRCRALSEAFEGFYSNCRIWGEVKTQTPKLAQARLGLLGVTQGLLRSLLQDQLGVPAPLEL
jgi:arginyl-tRNA synthetase